MAKRKSRGNFRLGFTGGLLLFILVLVGGTILLPSAHALKELAGYMFSKPSLAIAGVFLLGDILFGVFGNDRTWSGFLAGALVGVYIASIVILTSLIP